MRSAVSTSITTTPIAPPSSRPREARRTIIIAIRFTGIPDARPSPRPARRPHPRVRTRSMTHRVSAPHRLIHVLTISTQLHHAGMQTHPRLQVTDLPPLLGPETQLRLDRRRDRVTCRRERSRDPITHLREHQPPMRPHRIAQDHVMTSESSLHGIGLLLPPARRTLQVREQERHRARRKVHHRIPHL